MSDDHAWHALTDDLVGPRRTRRRPGAPEPSETTEVLVDAALAVLGAARSLLDLADRRLQARRTAIVLPAEPGTPPPEPPTPAPPPAPPRPARSTRDQIELTY
jgi:hypothetical protein